MLDLITIGFDLGTSSCKVAYAFRSGPNSGTPKIIDFKHGLKEYESYLYPSIMAWDDNCLLSGIDAAKHIEGSTEDNGIRNLKCLAILDCNDTSYINNILEISPKLKNKYDEFNIQLTNKGLYSKEYKPSHFLATFLAIALSHIKIKLVMDESIDISQCIFNYNICIPIDFITNNPLYAHFNKIFAVSDQLMKEFNELSNPTEILKRAVELSNSDITYDEENSLIIGIPEATAEISGYLKFFPKNNKYHGLIDIGAGTTEISIFYPNLYFPNTPEKSQMIVYWLASKIIPKACSNFDPANSNTNNIATLLQEIYKNSEKAWREAYTKSKITSDNLPKGTSNWAAPELKLFISGGGCYYEKDIINTFKRPIIKPSENHAIEILPPPHKYNSDIPYHRVSVAVGLTTPKPELLKYKLPNDMQDQKSIEQDLSGCLVKDGDYSTL